jgi:hypothetical protein
MPTRLSAVFFLVNATYLGLIREIIERTPVDILVAGKRVIGISRRHDGLLRKQ